MIKNIKLTAFRKHKNTELKMGEGLQLMRGVNEAGKSSVIEGLSYSLFGSSALRNSLDEVVTWTRPVKDLKAEVTLEIDGVVYEFARSKSGASVTLNGKPFVTGQTEVSAFAAKLLGADAKAAAHLMMAGQGELRGVLSNGPKAASTMIEGLSDLDLIERILGAAQEKLQLGSTAVLEERLKNLNDVIANTVIPVQPDFEAFSSRMRTLESDHKESVQAASVAGVAHLSAEQAFRVENEKQTKRTTLRENVAKLRERIEVEVYKHLEADTEKAGVSVPDPAWHETQIRNAEGHAAAFAAYETFLKIPQSTFRENRAEHTLARAGAEKTAKALQAEYTQLRSDLRVLESQWSTSSVCKSCGQDTAHLPHVQAKQVEISAGIEAAGKRLAEIQTLDAANDILLERLYSIDSVDTETTTFCRKIGAYVEIEDLYTPSVVTWKGVPPSPHVANVFQLKRELTEIKAALVERDRAQGRVEVLKRNLAELMSKISDTLIQVDATGCMEADQFGHLSQAYLDACDARTMAEGAVAALWLEMAALQKQYDEDNAMWHANNQRIAALHQQVEQTTTDIEGTTFGNALVKKLRAARPIIANKLWAMVLATVSTVFSQMRGETSIVTKTEDGFMINGKPVTSMSGSTLDLLGLSVRIALMKTFLPSCPFIILDEPSAACDSSRSHALVGFLASNGFKQTIMVSHDESIEVHATNLIQL